MTGSAGEEVLHIKKGVPVVSGRSRFNGREGFIHA